MGIHNYSLQVKGALRRLNESSLLKINKSYILKFYDFMCADGLSKARINRYLQFLKLFGEQVSKDFKKMNKDDIVRFVGWLESKDYSNWTKITYKIMLRRFFRWLYDVEETPPLVKWIKTGCKNSKRLPEEILTQDEVKLLIETATSVRDKALIAMLYESGCRVGELGNIQLKHVQFDQYGGVLLVNGKIGQRRVRIVSSVSYLAEWLNHHPFRNDPEAFLWVSLGRRHQLIDYGRIRVLIACIGKKAGISKRVNPHSFRHARATHLCNHLTEAQMKEYFGWFIGLYTYYLTQNIAYVFGVMGLVNFVYFVIDEVWKFMCK